MGTQLTLKYSDAADVLCIVKCPSYVGQETEGIADLVIARKNPQTREIEYLEIILLFRLLAKYGKLNLPIDATLLTVDAEATTRKAQYCSPNSALTIRYDQKGDLLNLDKKHPHHGQKEVQIGKGISARLNPETGEIENLEIHSFKARTEKGGEIILPINATLRPIEPAEAAN